MKENEINGSDIQNKYKLFECLVCGQCHSSDMEEQSSLKRKTVRHFKYDILVFVNENT